MGKALSNAYLIFIKGKEMAQVRTWIEYFWRIAFKSWLTTQMHWSTIIDLFHDAWAIACTFTISLWQTTGGSDNYLLFVACFFSEMKVALNVENVYLTSIFETKFKFVSWFSNNLSKHASVNWKSSNMVQILFHIWRQAMQPIPYFPLPFVCSRMFNASTNNKHFIYCLKVSNCNSRKK